MQAHRVQHAGRSTDQTRGRRSRHGLKGQPLDDEAAEAVQVHQMGKFNAVSKRTAGGDNRIGETHGANFYSEVDCGRTAHWALV